MKTISNLIGTLSIYNNQSGAFIKIIPINKESIIAIDDKRNIAFLRKITLYNPNDFQYHLCDIIFTGKAKLRPNSYFSLNEKVDTIHLNVDCDYDEYKKLFEIVLTEGDIK